VQEYDDLGRVRRHYDHAAGRRQRLKLPARRSGAAYSYARLCLAPTMVQQKQWFFCHLKQADICKQVQEYEELGRIPWTAA
jgi:hypothetical protein